MSERSLYKGKAKKRQKKNGKKSKYIQHETIKLIKINIHLSNLFSVALNRKQIKNTLFAFFLIKLIFNFLSPIFFCFFFVYFFILIFSSFQFSFCNFLRSEKVLIFLVSMIFLCWEMKCSVMNIFSLIRKIGVWEFLLKVSHFHYNTIITYS